MDKTAEKFRRKIQAIKQTWLDESKKDRTEATLKKEKALESFKLQFDYELFDNAPFQSLPFLMPKDEKNADIINDILKKSLETQASRVVDFDPLVSGCGFKIIGFLKYYFKNIPGKINIFSLIFAWRPTSAASLPCW